MYNHSEAKAEQHPYEDRETGTCRFCGQRVIDGAPEAGGDQTKPYWMTDPREYRFGGDYGCDESPETHPDEGVGSHAVTSEEVRRAEEWAAENNPPDAFDAFAQQDLEEKGVDPETAERVVRDTYETAGEATPRPWWIDEDDPSTVFAGNRDWAYLIQAPGESAQEIRANARLITRAVNAHEELVEAAEKALAGLYHAEWYLADALDNWFRGDKEGREAIQREYDETDEAIDLVNAALAKARGEDR